VGVGPRYRGVLSKREKKPFRGKELVHEDLLIERDQGKLKSMGLIAGRDGALTGGTENS